MTLGSGDVVWSVDGADTLRPGALEPQAPV